MNLKRRVRDFPASVSHGILIALLALGATVAAQSQSPRPPTVLFQNVRIDDGGRSVMGVRPGPRIYPVGLRQVEYVEPKEHRTMWMAVFYPAVIGQSAPKLFTLPFATNLRLHGDAELAFDGSRRPLIMLSHGRGSSAWEYAWLAQTLASHGYIVAAPNHYHANRYDTEIAYLANKIWQRPVDISLDITFLLSDAFWRKFVDPSRIGIAGHSQGGFTALWVGGARINPEKFLAFQRIFINNKQIPEHIRSKLPLDVRPALDVQDKRVRAVLAMAPGIIQVFGMDADGLRHLSVPTYLLSGAEDKQVPPKEDAEFAAKYIPNAKLWVIPGPVGHEIFTNECNEEGRDETPEGCIDAPGVDRAKLHEAIGAAALKFFGGSLHVP